MIVNHKKVATSKRLEQCSLAAFNAYMHLIGWHDDWSRGEWNERRIVGSLWPRKKAMLCGHVRKFLLEYQRLGLLKKYVVEDVEYFEWQAPEFPALPASRRRWMKCPPPPWAPKEEHARWAALQTGVVTTSGDDTLDLPFDEVDPTSSRPPNKPAETGHTVAGNSASLSVPAVPAVTTTPPNPPANAGGNGSPPVMAVSPDQVLATQIKLAEAYLIRLGGRSSRKIKRGIRHDLEGGWTFAEVTERLVEIAKGQLQQMRRWDWAGERPIGTEHEWPPHFEDMPLAHAPPRREPQISPARMAEMEALLAQRRGDGRN